MDRNIHPVLQDMMKLGCTNQRTVAIAFHVYMELCEGIVRALWDVQYSLSKELDLIFLTAKEHKSQIEPEIFIPLSVSSEISPAWLAEAQSVLLRGRDKERITLAFKDSDSTVVFYDVTNGLDRPDSPQSAQKKKLREEKQRLVQSELRRMRKALYDVASENSLHPDVD